MSIWVYGREYVSKDSVYILYTLYRLHVGNAVSECFLSNLNGVHCWSSILKMGPDEHTGTPGVK